MLSRGVGSRITGIPEGGVCVIVVVVVTVTWKSLKGRDGSQLKVELLLTGTSDTRANDHPIAPLLLRQKLKNSLQLSKSSVWSAGQLPFQNTCTAHQGQPM